MSIITNNKPMDMKKLPYILSALLLPLLVLAQTTSRNFIKSTSFQIETITGNVSNDKKIEVINYFDGLGRPLQRIEKQAGGNKQDIITPFGFDYFGRQKRDYLPYARTDSSLNFEPSLVPDYYGDIYELSNFYAAKFPDDFKNIHPSEANAFSEKYFEASPLSRIRKQSAPGVEWQLYKFGDNDHTIKFEYNANTTNDVVRVFTVSFTNENKEVPNLESKGVYSGLQLYKTITKNENWTSGKNNTTEEYKNKQGHIILKRTYSNYKDTNGQIISNQTPHDIYYVYDIYDNLTYVIPPKAIDLIGNETGIESDPTSTAIVTSTSSPLNITASNSIRLLDGFHAMSGSNFSAVIINDNKTILDNLCYQYKYDSRNRLVEKKVPGKGWEYIIYDKLDRPILTQDANLRTLNKWLFTKYDAFNRVVYTGEYINITQITRADIQNLANSNNTLYENRQASPLNILTTSLNYSNNAFPSSGIDLFTINYYDDYNNIDLDGATAATSYGITPITNAKSLSTCSKVRILGTTNWTTNVNYYDTKGRPIYTYSKNNFLATTATVKTQLDFGGKVLETTSTHLRTSIVPNVAVQIVDFYTYDHVGRLLTQKQSINNQVQEVIASNTYDNLGQLVTKGVGGKVTQSRLQNVDYGYNIRGWLKNINNINAIGSNLFAFQINYNSPTAGTPLYNGNISQTFWKTANLDNSLKNYTYSYDDLNRLTLATDVSAVNPGRYNESLSYDKNGNITNLTRLGHRDINATQFGYMDILTYAYTGNRLDKVDDSSGSTEGFKDGANLSLEYSYDENGNMKTDANKGITAIAYNYLNLPTSVSIGSGTVNYTYDATGAKQRKSVSTGSTTDYAGSFIYENNILKQFSQPEGYVVSNAGIYNYIYQYKDHLGNIRLSYQDKDNSGTVNSTEIVQENNYYAFGLLQKGYNDAINGIDNKYKFEGRELQDELGLNVYPFKYRTYDPALGRFWSVDPVAENYPHNGVYNFAENRVVESIDLEGKESWYTQDGHLATKAGPYTSQARQELNLYSPSEVQQAKAKVASNNGPMLSQDKMSPTERKDHEIAVKASIAEKEAISQSLDNHENRGSPYNAKTVMEGVAQGIPQIMLEGLIADGLQGVKFFGQFSSVEASAFSKIGSTGKVGEEALKLLGGESQVFMKTSEGGRYIDQLVGGVANESKVGYTSLTKSISTQIAKDAELLKSGDIKGAVWHFFKSPVTGKVGASHPLLDELAKNGIKTVIH